MKQFVLFKEVNEWEGETWHFWLQLTGNENEIDKLEELLDGAESDYDFPYSLDLDGSISESVVDQMVKYAEEGYMSSENKVTGTFVCPDDLGDYADRLYKGGISDFFN